MKQLASGTMWISLVAAGLVTLASGPAFAAHEADTESPGNVIVVKPELVKFTLKGVVYPLPSAANDPTVGGATLQIFDNGGQELTYVLPSAKWQAIHGGFKFVGERGVDACTSVVLKTSVIKATCKGPGVTLTLPLTAPLNVRLTTGRSSKTYCASFGGNVVASDEG